MASIRSATDPNLTNLTNPTPGDSADNAAAAAPSDTELTAPRVPPTFIQTPVVSEEKRDFIFDDLLRGQRSLVGFAQIYRPFNVVACQRRAGDRRAGGRGASGRGAAHGRAHGRSRIERRRDV